MNNDENILITLSNGEYLIKVAMKATGNMFTGDATQFPLEPENKEQFMKLLPLHCKNFGPIVEVEKLFDIVDITQ